MNLHLCLRNEWQQRVLKMTLVLGVPLILLFGCLPDPLEVDGLPKVKPEIVVSSQILPDGTLAVLLTRAVGALEASEDANAYDFVEQVAINDAFVTVSSKLGIDTLALIQNGVYGESKLPFIVGEEYQLHVVSPSMGQASASAVVQHFVPFDSVRAEIWFDGFWEFYAQVTYQISDPSSANFYMLNVQKLKRDNVLDDLINPNAFTRILDDKAFNGSMFSEVFEVYTSEFATGDSITVSLSSISKEYYDFVKLRIDNRLSFIEFLSEPVNYPTNIEGGKGFFNLYIADIRLMVL